MSYAKEINREIILDHLENPRNQKVNNNYAKIVLKNPACGDVITLFLLLKNNKIIDISYQVEGCSITKASVSIMSEMLKNKTIEEAKKISDQFFKMLIGQNYDDSLLKEANSLIGVKDNPPRIKCATLPYKALLELCGEKNDQL